MQDAFANPVARHIWETRYRYARDGRWQDGSVEDTWRRAAQALAVPEGSGRIEWAERFRELLSGFTFLPGGRILAGAGTHHHVTLFNCFVMGVVPDSLDGIFTALRESALTLQQGGGIGLDFSGLRPSGHPAWTTGNTATGPLSFMRVWNEMSATVQSLGRRRSAMMATLRCDHPDILEFIAAKRGGGFEHFNLAVQCTDEFMQALAQDEDWALVFPADAGHVSHGPATPSVQRRWPGHEGVVKCCVVKTLRARALWDALTEAAAAHGDPGVLFVDRINRENNLWYDEFITATNPCGEVPLPAYGACNLGSFNLTAFVSEPFTPKAAFDHERFRRLIPTAVRFLDNAIEVSQYPLTAQAEQVRRARRIGLGVTGLADALILLGRRYDSDAGREFAAEVFRELRDEAYRASVDLARERGPFPAYDLDYLSGAFIQRLPSDISGAMTVHGIRNSHLLAQAPGGSISLLAGNVSSGIEPVFGFRVKRYLHDEAGRVRPYPLLDAAWKLWQERHGGEPLSAAFVTADELSAETQLEMLGAIQPYVDNSISKTVALPAAAAGRDAEQAFDRAYALGLKGCTVFAEASRRGVIRGAETPAEAA
ncbi:MAG: adenosylcobalamin-dependent ribonucleoside-diphosphate reductase [Bacillota bacterium]